MYPFGGGGECGHKTSMIVLYIASSAGSCACLTLLLESLVNLLNFTWAGTNQWTVAFLYLLLVTVL